MVKIMMMDDVKRFDRCARKDQQSACVALAYATLLKPDHRYGHRLDHHHDHHHGHRQDSPYILKVRKFGDSTFQSQKICGKSA